jgi:hypothetical protein
MTDRPDATPYLSLDSLCDLDLIPQDPCAIVPRRERFQNHGVFGRHAQDKLEFVYRGTGALPDFLEWSVSFDHPAETRNPYQKWKKIELVFNALFRIHRAVATRSFTHHILLTARQTTQPSESIPLAKFGVSTLGIHKTAAENGFQRYCRAP